MINEHVLRSTTVGKDLLFLRAIRYALGILRALLMAHFYFVPPQHDPGTFILVKIFGRTSEIFSPFTLLRKYNPPKYTLAIGAPRALGCCSSPLVVGPL